MEAYFQRIDGVIDAVSGYANGNTQNPTYEDVSHRHSGHAETVQITYDTDKLSLPDILHYYLRVVNPTSLNQQGNDRGEQYRSGIYFTDPKEQAVIAEVLQQEQAKYTKKIIKIIYLKIQMVIVILIFAVLMNLCPIKLLNRLMQKIIINPAIANYAKY